MSDKKIGIKDLIKEAEEEGLNDTVADEVLSENALLLVNEMEAQHDIEFTDKQRDLIVEAYHRGFKKG